MFEFTRLRHEDGRQRGNPLSTLILVPKQSHTTIKGYHRSEEDSYLFLVAKYPEATGWQQRFALGSITAVFAPVWKAGAEPKDEPLPEMLLWQQERLRNVGTVPGPLTTTSFLRKTRKVGPLRAAVSIRYAR